MMHDTRSILQVYTARPSDSLLYLPSLETWLPPAVSNSLFEVDDGRSPIPSEILGPVRDFASEQWDGGSWADRIRFHSSHQSVANITPPSR